MTTEPLDGPRRALTGRRPEMTGKLLDAAVAEIADTGFEGMTVRLVAARAGVSTASAYSYFASKEHLLAAVFWRRISALPAPSFEPGSSLADRVRVAMTPVAMLVADEAELAAGVTTALLAHDADVRILRDQIGAVFGTRMAAAIGTALPPSAVLGMTMTFVGALLSAGMDQLAYQDIPDLLADLAAQLQVSS
jgi:AcrR family transcriptional regulator